MKIKTTKKIVLENILLLIPFILYGLYKNGYLIYTKGLISSPLIFKNIYLIIIAIIIKFGYDLITTKKILIDYNLVYLIIIGMIMPYNINLILYFFLLFALYMLSNYLEKHFKFNKVCFIFLIIILINGLVFNFSFLNPLEAKFTYSFSFFDLLSGRNIGGISSTSIIFSLISYTYLINTLYYKKDIPLTVNLTYLFLAFIYYLITKNNILLNSELIFASIFVAPLPAFSPYSPKHQILYSILIGIISFIFYAIFQNVLFIYLSIFIGSLLLNVKKI